MKKHISILIFPFLVAGCAFASEPKPLEIGATAPDFSLPGTDGKTYTLKSFASARLLVVVFTCNHCPTAQAYEDRIKKMAADYAGKKVALVAISPNDPAAVRLDELGYSDMGDSFEEMKLRAREKKYNFPYLYDGQTQKTWLAYGAAATPHVFVFDNARKLQYTGRFDDLEKPGSPPANDDARNAIEALLFGKPVPVAKTKTFGCSVKWKDKGESVAKGFADWAREEVKLETVTESGLRDLLKNGSGKLRLINVWATWCGPCVTEFPEFVAMNRMYRGRDFEFVSLSADEPEKKERALAFLKKTQASSQNYIFESGDIYKMIEIIDPKWQGALPYTMLVEPGGKVVYAKQGTIDPRQLKRAIVDNRLIGRYF